MTTYAFKIVMVAAKLQALSCQSKMHNYTISYTNGPSSKLDTLFLGQWMEMTKSYLIHLHIQIPTSCRYWINSAFISAMSKSEGGVENVMRLENPALVPQHKQPGLLFWSASLVFNNEWGEQWRHTGNHPHFWLRIGHAERVWICVFCARWWECE